MRSALVVSLAVSLAVPGLVACGQPAEVVQVADPRTRAPSPSPEGVPYDEGEAPLVFTGRTTLRTCGSYDLDAQLERPPAEALACLSTALRRREGAELVLSQLTAEGDPVISYYRALPRTGRLELFTDSTRDSYGSRTWWRTRCAGFDDRRGEPVVCDEGARA